MANEKLPANLFTQYEPATHPDAGAPANAPTVTALPAPTGVAAPVAAAPGPVVADPSAAVPSNLFEMSNPSGQTNQGPVVPLGNDPPGTVYATPAPEAPIDPTNAPAEAPIVKSGLITMGSSLGAIAGVPAGGLVADAITVPAGAILGGAAGSAVYDVAQNIIDAVRGTKNSQGEPITLTQQTIDVLKNGAMSTAGIAGQAGGNLIAQGAARALNMEKGYAGVALRAAGSIIGGGTGVATANLGVNQAEAVGKIWGLIPNDQRTPDLLESIKEAAMNGGLDMLVNTAMHSPLAAKAGARAAMFKLNGITPDMVTDAEVASTFGINLSPSNMSKSSIAKMYRSVVSVIPLIGHPYVDLYNKNVDAINAYTDTLADRAAISSTELPTKMSAATNAVDAANDAFKPVADSYTDNRNEILGRARANGARFSLRSKLGINNNGDVVDSLKGWAGSVTEPIIRSNTPQLDMTATGAQAGVKTTLPPPGQTNVSTVNKPLLTLANKILNAPDMLTADQIDAFGQEGEAIYKQYVEKGDPSDANVKALGDKIQQLKESMDGALSDSDLSHPEIGQAMRDNKAQYVEARKIFQTPLGTKLISGGNINKNVLGDAIYKIEDPAQVDELIKIVGKDRVADGASVMLQNAVSSSSTGVGPGKTFDVEKFAKDLELDNPSSDRYQAVSKALETTSGLSMKELQNFVKSARVTMKNVPPGLATMLTRKMTFGGLSSIIGSVFPLTGAALGHSFLGPGVGELGTAGATLLGWKGAEIMSNPSYLRDATTFMNPAEDQAARRMALFRVAQAVLPDDLPRYNMKGGVTGKTPPRAIMEKAAGLSPTEIMQGAVDQGSNFLRSLAPQ